MRMKCLTVVRRVFWPLYSSLQRGGKLLFSEQYLLYTNIGLCIGIPSVGDVLQQKYQHMKTGPFSKVPWDYTRTTNMAASGLLIGPFVHYWYQHLEIFFPGRCWKMLSKKVFVDLVISSPVCVVLFLVTTALLDGQGWNAVKEEFKKTGKIMYITDAVVWTPAQAINFYFLPVRFRMLYDSAVSLAVDTYFSHLRFGEHSSYALQVKQAIEGKKLSES